MSLHIGFKEIDKTQAWQWSGVKAPTWENLPGLKDIHVPDGFCVTTEAFKRIIEETPSLNALLDQLSLLKVEDRKRISELSGKIRRIIEGIAIPEDITDEITRHLSSLVKKMLMQYDPAPLQKIYRRPLLQASRIPI